SELTLPDDRIRTRRMMAHMRGQRLDMRASLRRAMRQGGEIITLARKRPRLAHPPVVALIDISGSMSEYSRILLHFLHELAAKRGRVHSFVFGTRLTNITRLMRAKDPDEALNACGKAAPDWEGGTRISAALHAFNRDWSRRVLSGSPIVLLFTDGLEREAADGETSLAFEMDRLHRSCRRLIWLNPLLRYDGFSARAGGIRAMLPHVDEFRPIHNLASMAALCKALDAATSAQADPRKWLRAA
ncbi:MAG: vWA domain-containing protein, partial [Bosea sp. (in: a-proteobacteria)]